MIRIQTKLLGSSHFEPVQMLLETIHQYRALHHHCYRLSYKQRVGINRRIRDSYLVT